MGGPAITFDCGEDELAVFGVTLSVEGPGLRFAIKHCPEGARVAHMEATSLDWAEARRLHAWIGRWLKRNEREGLAEAKRQEAEDAPPTS